MRRRQSQHADDDTPPAKQTLSRAEWLKRRRQAVGEALEMTPPTKSMTPADVAETWTEHHNQELQFNANKQLERVFDGLRSKTISEDEVPEEVILQAAQHFAKIEKNMLARERKELQTKLTVAAEPPRREELQGLIAQVPESLRSPRLEDELASLSCRVSSDVSTIADMYVVEDPAAIPMITKLAAALSGGWIFPRQLCWEKGGLS